MSSYLNHAKAEWEVVIFLSNVCMCHLGPSYDLTFCEVRDNSLVVEWKKPIYEGSEPITGYHVEYAKKGTSDWKTANEKSVSHRFLKVRGSLNTQFYVSILNCLK